MELSLLTLGFFLILNGGAVAQNPSKLNWYISAEENMKLFGKCFQSYRDFPVEFDLCPPQMLFNEAGDRRLSCSALTWYKCGLVYISGEYDSLFLNPCNSP